MERRGQGPGVWEVSPGDSSALSPVPWSPLQCRGKSHGERDVDSAQTGPRHLLPRVRLHSPGQAPPAGADSGRPAPEETPIGSLGVKCPPITVAREWRSDWPSWDTWTRRAWPAADRPFRIPESGGSWQWWVPEAPKSLWAEKAGVHRGNLFDFLAGPTVRVQPNSRPRNGGWAPGRPRAPKSGL